MREGAEATLTLTLRRLRMVRSNEIFVGDVLIRSWKAVPRSRSMEAADEWLMGKRRES